MTVPAKRVLTLNSGSSSLRAAVCEMGPAETRVLSMKATRIGLAGSRVEFAVANGAALPPRAVARRYALPRDVSERGSLRYGFHGLSYEYVMLELRALESGPAKSRGVIAHLGNGASMVAIRGGRPIDTKMGFSPAGGLVMGTPCGDLDPGVLVHLMRGQQMSLDAVALLINRQSGLLGVSGRTSDMRDLLELEASDLRAAEAVALFCYQAKKYLGAFAAALGGLDVLVFTGGIGEHAAPVRERVVAGMEFLGIELDPERNQLHEPVISSDGSGVVVRVIATNEELMVARHASRQLALAGRRDHDQRRMPTDSEDMARGES